MKVKKMVDILRCPLPLALEVVAGGAVAVLVLSGAGVMVVSAYLSTSVP